MYPWGHLPEDNPYMEDNRRVAEKGNEALFAAHGSVYLIDSIYNFFGMAGGGSIDWTMGDADIKYSFGMELRDTGEHGFLLPEDQGRGASGSITMRWDDLLNSLLRRKTTPCRVTGGLG